MTSYRAQRDLDGQSATARRGRLCMVVTIALAVGVSACQGTQPQRVAPPVAVAPPPPAPSPDLAGTPQPAKPTPPRPAAKAPAPVVVPEPVVTPAVIGQVIGQVIGMSQDDLRKTLGEPTERIDQGPGQAWVYKTPKCTVEVLFFLDVTRNGYYALDRKISVSGDPAERACYAEIQNARRN